MLSVLLVLLVAALAVVLFKVTSFISSSDIEPVILQPISSQAPELEDPLPSLQPTEQPNPSQSIDDQQTTTDNKEIIERLLNELSVQQKIGQLLIFGIEDKQLTKDHQQLIVDKHIGSVILFKRNISNKEQLSSFVQQLKAQTTDEQIPLWVSIDQEGGVVNRLPEVFPSAEQLAELQDLTLTYDSGFSMGELLKEYGINMDFAPVLDINSNANNPVIGSRAFGNKPEAVADQALAMMRGLQEHVITVGKHFPGHGDTSEDSHYTLPAINKSWEELQEFELIPFAAAIEANIDAIMVGHLYLPKVDDTYPASLSKEIVQHKLREEMGFRGLVISDDMVMEGITDHYSVGQAAILALNAGVDMLIVGHQAKAQKEVLQAITDAVASGEISIDLLNEHVERVLLAKLQP